MTLPAGPGLPVDHLALGFFQRTDLPFKTGQDQRLVTFLKRSRLPQPYFQP